MARVQGPSRLEPLVTRNQHGVQHGFAQEKVSHPLGYDNIHLLRELDALHVPLHHLNYVAHTVVLAQLFRVYRHVCGLDRVHLFGACLGGPNGKNAASGADIEYNLVLELSLVLKHGVVVRLHAHLVLQHFLLMVQVPICAEVVGEVSIGNVVGLTDRHCCNLFKMNRCLALCYTMLQRLCGAGEGERRAERRYEHMLRLV
mmetsp:Transcript_9164/g.15733  ORF Transcript_9164/g.15733 Transcript_9164/m.15733 type:complete len:201 (+) Transcript_9164:1029-1631(+)